VTALLGIVLVLAVLRALRSPQVRMGLAVAAGAAAAIAVAEGYAVVLLVLAVVLAAGTLGPVAFLRRFVVPVPARARRAS